MKHTECYIKDYPRPQFVRENWISLNGEWDFKFDYQNEGEGKGFQNGFLSDIKITVPFSYETPLSGINNQKMCKAVWYSKNINISEKQKTKTVMLNFEGSDYKTKVFVNGNFVGRNKGAYHRFGFDVTHYLKDGENVIVIKAEDDYSKDIPRGKQRWEDKNFGCWYVQTTGIYKSIWMEFLNEFYIENVKITPEITDDSVTFDVKPNKLQNGLIAEIYISFNGKNIKRVHLELNDYDNIIKVDLNSQNVNFQAEYWSPACPNLYDVKFILKYNDIVCDKAGSYFGLREIRVQGDKILLNSIPLYQSLILDQGYWIESHLTPTSEQAIICDIELMMEMGFNGARKHQKIEDERFLYYADILGFLVWCEMPSMYWFSDKSMASFSEEWQKIVCQNYNHPSLITWVPFNESWGIKAVFDNANQQNFTVAMYYLTKSIDKTRPVISNDGWEHTISDILTIHNYEQNPEKLFELYDNIEKLNDGWCKNNQKQPYAKGYSYHGQPIIISEFGGTSYEKDVINGWGYGDPVKSEEDYLKRFEGLCDAIKKLPHCSGFCYTQFTDVQQEVNGLLDENRNPKTDIKQIARIIKK